MEREHARITEPSRGFAGCLESPAIVSTYLAIILANGMEYVQRLRALFARRHAMFHAARDPPHLAGADDMQLLIDHEF